MARYAALLRDTWWVWLIIGLFGFGLGFVHWLFYSAFPIGIFSFLYFGMMRYDEQGNAREGF